jgi:hypothetical protein
MPAAREQRLVAADGNASSCPGDRFLFLPFFLSHNL